MVAHVTKRTIDESHESRDDHLAETIPQREKVSNARRRQREHGPLSLLMV